MDPLLPPTPHHLSGSSLCTSPKHPASCIEHILVICFLHDSIHVSMPFSQIILPSPSPSPSESKSPLYTSVSLLLSPIQGHHYHLSKFHMYVLVYCTGVFLSGQISPRVLLLACASIKKQQPKKYRHAFKCLKTWQPKEMYQFLKTIQITISHLEIDDLNAHILLK